MSFPVDQGALALFFALTIGHALGDFALQGSYLSVQKNRHLADSRAEWLVAITAHSLIHAGAVWMITGSILLGAIELVLHAIIDLAKCEKKFGHLSDQALHLLCKIGYVTVQVSTGMVPLFPLHGASPQ